MKLDIVFVDTAVIEIDYKVIKKILNFIFNHEDSKAGYIEIIFTSDKYLKDTNLKFLKHNYNTDIITFSEKGKNFVNGQLFISIERVFENSKKYAESNFKNELFRVVIHGILHLLGFEDYNVKLKNIMRKKEDFYLLNAI